MNGDFKKYNFTPSYIECLTLYTYHPRDIRLLIRIFG